MDRVNSVLVYKVYSQQGTWIFTDYSQAKRTQEVQLAIRPVIWVDEVIAYQSGELPERDYYRGEKIQWVNKATLRSSKSKK